MASSKREKRLLWVTALTGLIITNFAGGAGAAEQAIAFNISAESLGQALTDFSRESGQQMIFSEDVVRGHATKGLKGHYSVADGLRSLLAGSGLAAETNSAGVIMIRVAKPQDRPAKKIPAVKGDVPPEPGKPREDMVLETVIVTAEKRPENLQNVPMTVDTISGQQLASYGETHLTDFAASSPGLTVNSGNGTPGSVNLIIRGVSTGDGGNSPTVATYIDNVPVSSSGHNGFNGFTGVDLFPYDISHIEVLEGPQGTLYGASSLGGVLKYVMKTPDLNSPSYHLGGSLAGIDHGSGTGWGVQAAANVVAIPGKLAFSISGAHRYTPGYINNPATGQKGVNHGTQDGARLAVYWLPSDNVKVKLSGLYDSSNFAGYGDISVALPSGQRTYGYLDDYAVEPQGQKNRLTLLSGDVTYEFDGLSLKSITGYSENRSAFKNDASVIFLPIFGVDAPFNDQTRVDKFSQELRLTSSLQNRFHWVVGSFYTKENSAFSEFGQALVPGTQQPNPNLNPLYNVEDRDEFSEIAVYGNATYNLTKLWDVSAGLRDSHDHETLSSAGGGTLFSSTSYPTISSSALTVSVDSRYHFRPNAMGYLRIASGYRPGGANANYKKIGAQPTYKPDSTINYELGLKSEWLDKRIQANASVFYIDWQNIPIQVLTPQNNYYYTNAGKATSKGVELTTKFILTPGLQLGANWSFIDARLKSDAPLVGGSKGDRLPGSPRWSGILRADYSHSLTGDYVGRLGLMWRYVGNQINEFPHGYPYQPLPSYSTLAATAGVSTEHWTLSLYAENITDKQAYVSWSDGPFGPNILQPRTIGVSIDHSF